MTIQAYAIEFYSAMRIPSMLSNFSLKSEMNPADICNGQFCLSSFERAKTGFNLFDLKSVTFVGYRVIDHMI